MTYRTPNLQQPDRALEKLGNTLAGLDTVDANELKQRLYNAAIRDGVDVVPPRPDDIDGSSYYFTELMATMAEALAAQQERIEELEAKLAAKK